MGSVRHWETTNDLGNIAHGSHRHRRLCGGMGTRTDQANPRQTALIHTSGSGCVSRESRAQPFRPSVIEGALVKGPSPGTLPPPDFGDACRRGSRAPAVAKRRPTSGRQERPRALDRHFSPDIFVQGGRRAASWQTSVLQHHEINVGTAPPPATSGRRPRRA
jgi:hypothetical protein